MTALWNIADILLWRIIFLETPYEIMKEFLKIFHCHFSINGFYSTSYHLTEGWGGGVRYLHRTTIMIDPLKIEFTTSVMLCETRMLTIAPWCAFKFTLVTVFGWDYIIFFLSGFIKFFGGGSGFIKFWFLVGLIEFFFSKNPTHDLSFQTSSVEDFLSRYLSATKFE